MTSVMKAKHQRLILVGLALVAIIGAGFIAAWALRSQADFFYVPAQMEADPPEIGQSIRLGGMVQENTLKTLEDGITVSFIVGDGEGTWPVRYTGILPDLFVEGSGVVADGALAPDGVFVADSLLAKHDENYVPKELEEMTAEQAKRVVAETESGR